jgi:hypothetical protein
MMKALAKELHAPVKHKYPRRKVFVNGIDNTWAMDLVDMTEWKKKNGGFGWMLNIVDVFSRYAWSVPVVNKTAKVVLDAFINTIYTSNRKPEKIWVDEGKEFYNNAMKGFLKSEDIVMYSTHGQHKSMFVERFNRTLKGRMWRRFTEENTRVWINMLPELIVEYNNGKHRSLPNFAKTPIEASKKENESKIMLSQAPVMAVQTQPKGRPKFTLGQWVRISRQKGIFEKGYLPNWSREIYKVTSILHCNPRMYGITDTLGEPIVGTFYEQELQATLEIGEGSEGLIETTLKTKTVKGKKKYFVKWLGYSDRFNTWVDESDITKEF